MTLRKSSGTPAVTDMIAEVPPVVSPASGRPHVVVTLEEPFWRVSASLKLRSQVFQNYGEALAFAKELAARLNRHVEVDTGIDRFDLGPGDRLISKNPVRIRPVDDGRRKRRRTS